jgi:hypothetical protein
MISLWKVVSSGPVEPAFLISRAKSFLISSQSSSFFSTEAVFLILLSYTFLTIDVGGLTDSRLKLSNFFA